ncbi:MAG: hypothetical protein ABI995_00105 [Acidobacteriota bacterium]
MQRKLLNSIAVAGIVFGLCAGALRSAEKKPVQHFQTSDRCQACHNSLTTSTGEDVSIGLSWRTSMMANSGRDPYWMAGVRREVTEHPESQKAIEDECTICHMPMMRYQAHTEGRMGEVFSHLPVDMSKSEDRLAADGVSCSLCHQITPDKLGTRESLVGGFVVDTSKPKGQKVVYGPYKIDEGHQTVMRTSSGGWKPTEGEQIRKSELCATCHTLITKALGPDGKEIGSLPEQMPYQEWFHSDYKETKSCQSCHMPVVEEKTAVTRVLGGAREGMSRHTFIGGNFFLQRMLGKYRIQLNVPAMPNEMESAADQTIQQLQTDTVKLSISSAEVRAGRLETEVAIENLSGHKFPTAYPSRRSWLHVTVKDRNGRPVFESGALEPSGLIKGNDNDADPLKYEPHYTQITAPDQVQIYEGILFDSSGKPTTGLLSAIRYEKDNRLLPKGFNKATADDEIAVRGSAAQDPNFQGGGDRVAYSIALGNSQGPYQIEVEMYFQPISFRWAENLKKFDFFEPKRFVGWYESMSSGSATVIGKVSATR